MMDNKEDFYNDDEEDNEKERDEEPIPKKRKANDCSNTS